MIDVTFAMCMMTVATIARRLGEVLVSSSSRSSDDGSVAKRCWVKQCAGDGQVARCSGYGTTEHA